MTPRPPNQRQSIFATRDLTLCGCLGALALVIPQAFHMVPGGGPLFMPMFWPVLALGLLCRSWWLASLTGAIVPILSSALTGMPPLHLAPLMAAELACLALVSSLARRANLEVWPAALLAVLCLPVLRCFQFMLLAGLVGIRGTLAEYALGGFVLGSWPGLVLLLTVVPGAVAGFERRSLFGQGPRGRIPTDG